MRKKGISEENWTLVSECLHLERVVFAFLSMEVMIRFFSALHYCVVC